MSRKYTRRSVIAAAAGLVGASASGAIGGGTAHAAPTAGPTAAPNPAPNPAPNLQPNAPALLWYDKPATSWEREALPIGNGAMGAKVFGGVARDRLQLNEKSLWTGGPGSKEGYDHGNWPKPRPGAIADVQKIIDEKGALDPDEVSRRLGNPTYATVGKVPGFGDYQNFGDLFLDTPGAPASPVGYRRGLDIADAVATVSYSDGQTRFTREYFASHPAGVVAGRVSADRPGQVSFTLSFKSAQAGASVTAKDGRLLIRGALADNGLRYEGQVQVLTSGGTRTDGGDGRITVTGADSATFVFCAGTDYAAGATYPHYRGDDPHARVTAAVDRAAGQTYGELRKAHVEDHRALFDRVRLDIGQCASPGASAPAPEVPTDQLLSSYTGGASSADRALEALFFAYGRYLLIASSRPGSLPANLQGVWNNSNTPPWNADYHTNINVQMNYWPAEPANLAETAQPYHDFIDDLRAPGRRTAQSMFGTDKGWVVHQNTNPFGFTGVHDWSTSFWMPEANGWLVQQLYERYLFSRDRDFLREHAYPAMREAAEFWLANLHTDPRDGKLVVSPSYSPEQGDFTAGASISQQIVHDLLVNVVEASEALGSGFDEEFRTEVKAALTRLDPGLRIGSWGQLQEWKADLDSRTNTHRHVSHLFALHPGRQIEAGSAYAEAARVSLTARGDGGTGWSKAWKINFWARLCDGDHAAKMLAEQLKSSTLPNLWDTHPPFQIDGNFGATSGIVEMLLQSHGRDAVVDVLPALPSLWAERGSYDGLRARGDFTVGVDWRQGAATEIRIASGSGVTAKLRSPLFAGPSPGPFRVVRVVGVRGGGDDEKPVGHAVRDGVLTLPTRAGERYRIVAQAAVTVELPGTLKPGAAVTATATLSAVGSRTLSTARLSLGGLPDGWAVTPATVKTPRLKPGEPAAAEFTLTPPAAGAGRFTVRATARTSDWSVSATRKVLVFDAPEVGARVRDDTTRGDWKGAYGEDGWELPGFGRKNPEGVVLDTSQAGGTWTWHGNSTEARALQHPTEAGRRILPSWYGDTVSFIVDTGTNAKAKRVALYLVDGDGVAGGHPRDEEVSVSDAAGTVYDTFRTGRFDQGFWVAWTVKGRVTITLRRVSGANAGASGIFIG
ncbi:glycoside hydrolase N-terminal domain-containing protein [Streptomyces sp. NPDC002994]|uniref:glycosyl hydrolase family 95 catalytic domain-containing protein n=1 Tax=Streptomyces sp. NPDC002994 TaxID=3154441 RepID=UPI00339E61D5